MIAALLTEGLKLRRSRVSWITVLACTLGVAVGGLFMFISADPARARALGLLGAKAELAGLDVTWTGFLALLAQIVAVGGLLIFGMTTVWIFGREFADHTAKDLLALPTTRTRIVMAKYAVAALWCLLLIGYLILLGVIVGAVLRLPGWTAAVVWQGAGRIVVTALLTIALTTTFGLAASWGRGYLPGIVAMGAALFTAQIAAAIGYGRWYPYAVPSLLSGMAGPGHPPPGSPGYVTVGLIAVAGVVWTVRWWNTTDHRSA